MKLRYYSIIAAIGLYLCGCKKLVEVAPPVIGITGNSVYTADATAISVLTGMYSKMSSESPVLIGTTVSLSLGNGISADELNLWSGSTSSVLQGYFKNNLSTASTGTEYWQTLYPYIFQCNDAINGLTQSTTLTPAVKQQLLGEAKFMRAFFYFYLVNLYGSVPLAVTNDYQVNSFLPRSSTTDVYNQIATDLKDAETLLSDKYLDATLLKNYAERVRPTKWAACALLARVYLYMQKWPEAEAESTTLINNTGLFSLSSLPNCYLKASLGNNEAIWQLQPVNLTWNTEDAKAFIIPATGPGTGLNAGVYLSNFLLNSFEAKDKRRFGRNWIDSVIVGTTTYYYPYKYKVNTSGAAVTEFLTILRLGEQYLIRAEARSQQNNVSGAQTDLNIIRTRAGLPNTLASDKNSLLSAIFHERQTELFCEFGQRWLDLKRTGNIDAVMNIVTPQKGGSWQTFKQLYPIPLTDLSLDPNLIQNTGY